MAEATQNESESTLSSLFKSVWDTYLFLENQEDSTGCDKVQGEIRKALGKSEEAITMINHLQLFSENEDIDEVATNEIKYMLVPGLLGYFHGLNTHASRLETIKKAKSHYRDFLKMCKLYKVSPIHIPVDTDDEEDKEASSKVRAHVGGMDLYALASQRQSKIERFRQRKAFESRLKELSEAVEKESVDEEVKREFYLTQLKRWINIALDELDSFNCELELLKNMALRKEHGREHGDEDKHHSKPAKFRPFILTKDALQKNVFGAGYPSLPSLTIEEFYEQKVAEGSFSIPHSGHAGHSLQERAEDPEKVRLAEEREDAEIEKKKEEDDPELLQQARRMDEFKDENRRGCGNRKNMG